MPYPGSRQAAHASAPRKHPSQRSMADMVFTCAVDRVMTVARGDYCISPSSHPHPFPAHLSVVFSRSICLWQNTSSAKKERLQKSSAHFSFANFMIEDQPRPHFQYITLTNEPFFLSTLHYLRTMTAMVLICVVSRQLLTQERTNFWATYKLH